MNSIIGTSSESLKRAHWPYVHEASETGQPLSC